MTDRTMNSTEVPKRRTARVRLDPCLIASLLALPSGYTVRAVDSTNDPVGINVIIESDELPEVEHGVESPAAQMFVESVKLDDGRRFLRVEQVVVPR